MKKKKEERGRVGERERREEWEGGGGREKAAGNWYSGIRKGPSFRDSILSQNVNFTSVLVKDFQL